MSSSSITIYAILADLADVDELITTINRPGIVSAMATFIRKITAGLSISVIGLLLELVGYDETLASAGARQSAATQAGIAYIYIFLPVALMLITLFFTIKFPMNKSDFAVIQKEVLRRKGEDTSETTEEEKKICERVTGFAYDKLWNKDNALKF
jgi:oligogalacturonide transporter